MIVDEDVEQYASSPVQKDAYEVLASTRSWCEMTPRKSKYANGLRFFCNGRSGRKVFSHLNEKDVSGRPIVYMFQNENPTCESFVQSLKESLSLIPGAYTAAEDVESLPSLERRYRVRKKMMAITGLAVLIALIIVIVFI